MNKYLHNLTPYDEGNKHHGACQPKTTRSFLAFQVIPIYLVTL